MLTHTATTTQDVATHSHLLDAVVGLIPAAVLLLVIVAAGYLTRCWLFPFTTCRHDSQFRLVRCRFCKGTGTRLRAGRRLLNHIRAARRH